MSAIEERSSVVKVESNYFVCTLGQAAELKTVNSHQYRTVIEFLDYRKAASPEEPAVGFPTPSPEAEDGGDWDYEVISFEDLHRGSIMFADLLKGHLPEHQNKTGDTQFTVALLCPSSPLFLFAWLGLMRLGLAVLLIAPQCHPSAVAHLCRSCSVSVLFYDEIYEKLAFESVSVASETCQLHQVLLPFTNSTESLYEFVETQHTEDIEIEEIRHVSDHDTAYLHHTSGTSSGLPKPISQSHSAAVGVLPCFPDGALKATFTTTPLYHGGIADCFRAWTSGALIWLFPGKEVPITAQNILKSLECAAIAATENEEPPVKYFSSVPYVLQMLSEEPKAIEILRSMEIVGVGGAALSQSVGDGLVANGVNLVSRFGSAECGFLMSSHRDYTHDQDWQYLRSTDGAAALMFEQRENDLYELVVLSRWPHVAKHNREDGSFATADLFVAHPTTPTAWKYHSRADSQLTLITGKKFDPAPLESAIAASPLLKDVLIFGNGYQYPGALLFRSSSTTDLADSDLVERLWPLIDKLNLDSQGHSCLSKSMLVVMPNNYPSPEKSSKGSILRSQAETRYSKDIERAYREPPISFDSDSSFPAIADEAMEGFVEQTIKDIINKVDNIPEKADLFAYGVDSVACMRIRAILQRRVLPSGSIQLPLNIVYDCGSIAGLSEYMVNLRHGKQSTAEDELQLMQYLVKEYGTSLDHMFKHSRGNVMSMKEDVENAGAVVILTGATGILGAHILDQLRANPSVSKIYCLTRAADATAAEARVDKSLAFRKKEALHPGGKVVCLIAKLGDRQLGLSEQTYSTLIKDATVIIHAAWAVNFSMRLRSFVKDHISGLCNLFDLAMQSPHPVPPCFVFCSSTASVLGPAAKFPIQETFSHDPMSASPLGYSRSKWVAEAICEQAHLRTRLHGRVCVARTGQLCGDIENGIWNVTEAWPLMLSTVHATRSLPALEHEELGWLPVDIAAQAVVQIALSQNEGVDDSKYVYHLVNDNQVPTWMEMLGWMKKLCSDPFEVIPPDKWVEQLEKLDGHHADHPAKKLLALWKENYVNEAKSDQNTIKRVNMVYVKDATKKAAPIMENIATITEGQFGRLWRWIEEEITNRQASNGMVEEASVVG